MVQTDMRRCAAFRWWHFYFTSLYVSNRHPAWEQLSDGTSTSHGCVFQTDSTRSCSRQMTLLLYKSVCFNQTSRANAAVRWHFYFTSLYVSIIHHAWVQLADGTSTSQVCMFQTDITRECSSMMTLLLQKCVCFIHTSRVTAAARWHSYFTSVYVSKIHHAWVQLSYGSSNAQVCILQTDMRRCAAFRWHFYGTRLYVSNRNYAWV